MDTLSAFTTLFVTVDPVGLAPIFGTLTAGLAFRERTVIALEASLLAWLILIGSAAFGTGLLALLGIGIPAFRIAGGLLLFVIAFEMIFEYRQDRKEALGRQALSSLAAFPLAIPLMAGPGAIAATLLLAAEAEGDIPAQAALLGVITATILLTLTSFLLYSRIEQHMGPRWQIVFSRLLGVLLAALAVQYVIDGVMSVLGA